MFIDLHVHERLYSRCSKMSIEEVVHVSKEIGLDGICITDHNSMDIREHEFVKTCDFPIFVGIEVTTTEGDMIAYGIPFAPKRPIGSQEFINYVEGFGGFCYAAHPFRDYTGCLGEYIELLDDLHGVEILNGGNADLENLKSVKYYFDNKKLIPMCGSDAHKKEEIGKFVTWIPDNISSVNELSNCLKSRESKMAMRSRHGKYNFIF